MELITGVDMSKKSLLKTLTKEIEIEIEIKFIDFLELITFSSLKLKITSLLLTLTVCTKNIRTL